MPSVLVTGASRGIGKVSTLWLAARGWNVIAGVRRPEDGEALTAEGPRRVTAVTLDVTDSDQIAALDGSLPETLDAVVNNAERHGRLGSRSRQRLRTTLRRQLEVNVVGQAAVTQAVLPRLRASRGRVLFVSSLSGRVATPLMGPYSASKFALEGMADALRMELAPWGIAVVLVEPAQTDTDMWRQADVEFDQGIERLAPRTAAAVRQAPRGIPQDDPAIAKGRGTFPDRVAATIEKALTDRRPRAQVRGRRVGGAARPWSRGCSRLPRSTRCCGRAGAFRAVCSSETHAAMLLAAARGARGRGISVRRFGPGIDARMVEIDDQQIFLEPGRTSDRLGVVDLVVADERGSGYEPGGVVLDRGPDLICVIDRAINLAQPRPGGTLSRRAARPSPAGRARPKAALLEGDDAPFFCIVTYG